jgi:hypothetical protein
VPARPTIPTLGAVESRDVAELAEDHGPSPLRRAVMGLGVGVAAGVLAALLTPRPARARRRTEPS